jgi:hypothetical protein
MNALRLPDAVRNAPWLLFAAALLPALLGFGILQWLAK